MSQAVVGCIDELRSLLADKLKLDENSRDTFSRDQSYHLPHLPSAVVSAATELDIATTLRTCNKFKVPVIPFTAGSSIEGNIIPVEYILKDRGTITLDLSGMDKILSINPGDMTAVVQPGVNITEFNDVHLKPLGLCFAPDPGQAACIGGMCGTNCSGSRAFRYGTMKDNVLKVRCVLADGTVINTRGGRASKSSAGYDLCRLFIGSEGTLGVISEITLTLRRLPPFVSVALVQFGTPEDMCAFVESIALRLDRGDGVARIEMVDDLCLTAFKKVLSAESGSTDARWLALKEQFTLLVELVGRLPHHTKELSETFCKPLAEKSNSTYYEHILPEDPNNPAVSENLERVWTIRKRAHFVVRNLHPLNEKPGGKVLTLSTDAAVPLSHFAKLLRFAREESTKMNIFAPMVAHAGNGNLHAIIPHNIYDPEETARVERFRDMLSEFAIAHEGTCSGEHAVGMGKRELLVDEVGAEAVETMRKIKMALDPNSILNPDKVFTLKPKSKL
ncbi:hypothetical protein BJ742DRAFT_837973 [Cladochytrium replicatum]|nr:hypothetical protein BJ742DRAFT_837973 [Cladochytrium replicatum]